MKQLLFIGHQFHEKTRSSDFLLELLKEEYEITTISVDPYSDDPYSTLTSSASANTHFDTLICWQIKPPIKLLKKSVSFDHGVFFPMFDSSAPVKKIERWYPYRNFHIICFCQSLEQALTKAGFCAHAIQYFPEPANTFTKGDPEKAFFWNRTEDINGATLNTLFGKAQLKSLHIHKALDPGESFTPPQKQIAEELTYSDWFPKKSDMLEKIEQAGLYIAPRKKEGIGMSFLEAMAMGRCVIAPNYPTMNEYITHGENGILYDLDDPAPLNLQEFDITAIQKKTRTMMLDGRSSWNQKKKNILTWISQPVETNQSLLRQSLLARFITRPIKISKLLIREKRQ